MPDKALEFIEHPENRRTAAILRPILEQMRREAPPLYLILALVAGWVRPLQDEEVDHAALRRWRAGETDQDRYRAQLFDRAVAWVETKLYDQDPHLQIRVVVPRKDQPVESKMHARNQDNNALKTYTAHDRYRKLDDALSRIMQEEGCTVEAAIGLYRDRLEIEDKPDVSPATCYRARAFAREEEESA